jgi:hypothetical protein
MPPRREQRRRQQVGAQREVAAPANPRIAQRIAPAAGIADRIAHAQGLQLIREVARVSGVQADQLTLIAFGSAHRRRRQHADAGECAEFTIDAARGLSLDLLGRELVIEKRARRSRGHGRMASIRSTHHGGVEVGRGHGDEGALPGLVDAHRASLDRCRRKIAPPIVFDRGRRRRTQAQLGKVGFLEIQRAARPTQDHHHLAGGRGAERHLEHRFGCVSGRGGETSRPHAHEHQHTQPRRITPTQRRGTVAAGLPHARVRDVYRPLSATSAEKSP